MSDERSSVYESLARKIDYLVDWSFKIELMSILICLPFHGKRHVFAS